MAISIPSYPNPFEPAKPVVAAYAWTSFIALDLFANQGRLQLNINPNLTSWSAPPMGTISVALGQVFVAANPAAVPPVAEVRFPRLDELMADPAFASAYNTIGSKLYAALLLYHPALAGATSV